jgi:hypothetical protein
VARFITASTLLEIAYTPLARGNDVITAEEHIGIFEPFVPRCPIPVIDHSGRRATPCGRNISPTKTCRSWYCSHWDCGECAHRGSISAGQRMIGADYHLHLHPRTHAVHRHLTRTHHREPAVPDSAVASSRVCKPSGVSCGTDATPLYLRFVSENSNLSGNQDGTAVVQAANGGSARLRQPRTAAAGSAGR